MARRRRGRGGNAGQGERTSEPARGESGPATESNTASPAVATSTNTIASVGSPSTVRGRGGTIAARGSPLATRGTVPSRGGIPLRGAVPSHGNGGVASSARTEPSSVGASETAPEPQPAITDQPVAEVRGPAVRDSMPLRPGFGTIGRVQVMKLNSFAIHVSARKIYEYIVQWTSPPPFPLRTRGSQILQFLKLDPHFAPFADAVAMDRSGKRLVSARSLPQPFAINIQTHTATTVTDGPVSTAHIYRVEEHNIDAFNRVLDGHPGHEGYNIEPILSALNLVIQQHASSTALAVISPGRNRFFFRAPASPMQLDLGVEAWQGFFIAVCPTYRQLTIKVNACVSPFSSPGNAARVMIAIQEHVPEIHRFSELCRFFKSLKATVTLPGRDERRVIITGVENSTARQLRLGPDEYGNPTIEEYLNRRYNIALQHADDLPLIKTRNRGYLPAELCEICPGQLYRWRLSKAASAQLIKYARNLPAVNAAAICDRGFPDLGFSGNSVFDAFGITVEPNMITVPTRVLPPPELVYGQHPMNRPVIMKDASWNIVRTTFHTGANITSWAVLLVQRGYKHEFSNKSDPQLLAFLQAFSSKLRSTGMSLPAEPSHIMDTGRILGRGDDLSMNDTVEKFRQVIISNLNPSQKPSFVLVLLPTVNSRIYSAIKYLGDIVLGLQSIHIVLHPKKSLATGNMQDQYLSNVALKLNTKLAGTNHRLGQDAVALLTRVNTMIVGMVVTHPTEVLPAVAAVVSSSDDEFIQYSASLRLQSYDDIVESLHHMMLERLQYYRLKNGRLPDHILVYRQGLSNAQICYLMQDMEVPQIWQAFREIDPNGTYKPKLTIIVCIKQTRCCFHAADTWQRVTKSGNVVPGTVQDRGTPGIYAFDFLLQPHEGTRGQAQPTRYIVAYDDYHYDADTIQQITHALSYSYVRATKAIKMVPPVRYADLAAKRAALYLSKLSTEFEQPLEPGSEDRNLYHQRAIQIWGSGIHRDLKDSMFYI
ncbi:Piwi-domain-containing protein [Wolfiporia cocos MD-104 SS10]|uniref:Piwi-domain-containing protein n=1 Tax=Wolfiporia cocos (strain MD-104) TaxID=742152 RepID=A0A2H3IXT8_WOLCO|nr:Piwi-domain-containing protein [Wolfiporia cocos MD-104 SS10]